MAEIDAAQLKIAADKEARAAQLEKEAAAKQAEAQAQRKSADENKKRALRAAL